MKTIVGLVLAFFCIVFWWFIINLAFGTRYSVHSVMELQNITVQQFTNHWLSQEPLYDFDGDGIVNFKDFAILTGD